MTKKEILEKLENLPPEQKDFVVEAIKKHSRRKEDSLEKENAKREDEK